MTSTEKNNLTIIESDVGAGPSISNEAPTSPVFGIRGVRKRKGIHSIFTYPPKIASHDQQQQQASACQMEKEQQQAKSTKCYEPWNDETIFLFFDALKQHGKDFVAIKTYIASKSKTGAKNYDQVRNFYYNTLGKASNSLNLCDIDAPKEAKELFTLVNYGEWLRKTKSLKCASKNFAQNFVELVRKGCTSIKIRISLGKGGPKFHKWIKIKTPTCPALKKFADVGSVALNIRDETTLTKTALIELMPKTFADRGYVLDCQQNPMLRFSVNLNTPIADVFAFLQSKWIPPDVKRLKQQFDENISEKVPTIVLYPDDEATFRAVTIKARTTSTTTGVAAACGLDHCFAVKKNDVDAVSWVVGGNNNNNAAADDGHPNPNPTIPDGHANPNSSAAPVVVEVDSNADSNDAPTTDDDVEPIEIIEDNLFNASHVEDMEMLATDVGDVATTSNVESISLNPDVFRDGLSANNCGNFTIGQLCLMCDYASKLRLFYSIESKIIPNSESSPAWLSFVKLIKQDFVEILNRKISSNSDFVHSSNETTNICIVTPPANQSPAANQLKFSASPMVTPSRSKKRIISTMKQTQQQNLATLLPKPVTIMAAEGKAFILSYQQMPRKKPVVVTRKKQFNDPAATLVDRQLSNAAAVDDEAKKRANSETLNSTVADFTLSNSNSIFGFSSPVRHTTKIDDVGSVGTFDLTFDSPLKAVSNSYGIDESSLPRDVRRSFEMMMNQDSMEYCKHFEGLAGDLETPKKCRSPDR